MPATAEHRISAPDHAIAAAQLALEAAVRPEEGAVTPAIEAQVQHALHLARSAAGDPQIVVRLESISTMLQTMSVAKLEGRPNLYASRLLRLRRLVRA